MRFSTGEAKYIVGPAGILALALLASLPCAWAQSVSVQSQGLELVAEFPDLDPAGCTFRPSISPDEALLVRRAPNFSLNLQALRSDQSRTLTGHTACISGVDFSPDGARFISRGEDRTARLWSASGDLIATIPGSGWRSIFSPDGGRVVLAERDGRAELFDTDAGTLIARVQAPTGAWTKIAFSADGSRFVSINRESATAKVWRAENGQLIAELAGHADRLINASFSPDGERIVTAGDDRTARIWRALDGSLVATLSGHRVRPHSAEFSPDGARIVTQSSDRLSLWNAADGALVAAFEGHKNAIFSADSLHIFTSGPGHGVVNAVRAADGGVVSTSTVHASLVARLMVGADGRRLLTFGFDNTARLLSAPDLRLVAELPNNPENVYYAGHARFSPDGARIVLEDSKNSVMILRSSDGASLARFFEGPRSVVLETQIASARLRATAAPVGGVFLADSRHVMTWGGENATRIWRLTQ